MKNIILVLAITVSTVFTFYSCGSNTPKSNVSEKKLVMKTVYTCEMHPEVMLDQPGKCPKCGMELVKKEVAVSDSMQMTTKPDSLKK